MKSLKRLLILLTIFLAFGASVFLSWGYSSLLDFFPWGDSKTYVIWEPLVLYFIVPPLILVGCFLILLSKQKRNQFIGLRLLIIGLSFTLPSIFGFDSEPDLKGRWCGVIVAVLAIVVTTTDILKEIKKWMVQPGEVAVNKNDLQQKL